MGVLRVAILPRDGNRVVGLVRLLCTPAMTRIQRKRTRGWRSPAGTKYVGRPSYYGNPYTEGTPSQNADRYHRALESLLESGDDEFKRDFFAPLMSARHLSCWCKVGEACHADLLVELCTRLRAAASVDGEENEG